MDLFCNGMRKNLIALSLLFLLLLFAGFYLYSKFRTPKRKPAPVEIKYETPEPQFRHDANLAIMRSEGAGDTLKVLEIEIVNNERGITTGLMFRKSMEEQRGMLFIFPDVEMRSFWMRNTHISLDIVFIDEEKRIVNIQPNTKPYSDASIPSTGPAKYVLEVNAGMAEKYGWKPGDRVEWELIP
jgi:uncharacterized membrane protein (UPF0127 family)